MRTFIAIELPENIKGALAQLQEKLKAAKADVKWVEPQNIHLTLKFLGEIDEGKLEKIRKILEDISGDNLAFQIRLGAVGAFPKMHFPRVLWVGIDKGDIETRKIAAALEEKTAKIGIPKEERAFSSHITIGRTKSDLNRQQLVEGLKKMESNWEGKNLEFSVTKITLYKSTLGPGGPVYEALKEATLKTA